jgi:elongation factor 1-beta
MAVVAIKIKVMPLSPETDLEKMKKDITESLLKAGAIRIESITEEPIAFGLKALIVFFAWPEQKDTELAEETIRKVENVSSLDTIDYRRAFG